MFREMRRKKQLLSEAECADILERGSAGVLSLLGDDSYPYGVPMSYFYGDGKVYFHSADSGHKIDALRNHGKASFCVIDQDHVMPEEYTTYFRSVIAFGQVRVIADEQERRRAILALGKKYYPDDSAAHRDEVIAKEGKTLCMLELCIEHMAGKEAIELVKRRRPGAVTSPEEPGACESGAKRVESECR